MTTPEITRGEHAKLRRLHFDRERVLDLGWLHSGTPVSSEQEDYEEYLEHRKKKTQTMSQPPPPFPMIVFMVPTPSTPFMLPEMSQLLNHTFSKMQVSHVVYIGDKGGVSPIGTDVWQLSKPNPWPTNQNFPNIQGYDCAPANVGHEKSQAGSSENTQRTSEPAMISTVKAPPRIIEELPEPEPSEPEQKLETKEKEKPRLQPKSMQIFHPNLESFCDLVVELDHGSPLNWIPRTLLNKSGIKIVATKYVAHDTQHGTRLESSHRAKLDWKVANHSRRMQHDFRVHDSDSTAPNIIIGKVILEVYGEDFFPNHKSSHGQEERPHFNTQQQQFGHGRERPVKSNSLRSAQVIKRTR